LEYQGGNWVTIDNNNGYLNHDCPPFVFHIPLYPNFFVYISPLNPIKSHYNPYYHIKSHIYICIYVYMYLCISVYVYVHVYIYIYTHLCVYTYIYVYIHAFMCVYIHLRVYI
jgi:hypothetical protein